MNDTESLANSFNETRSVFYCPMSPQYIWDLNRTTHLKIILAVTIIACPVTILLNLLVIIAVKTRRELKENSNILLSSLAVADLLVGAVCMPLTITLSAFVVQGIFFDDIICTIDIISIFLVFTVYNASFFNLLLISWERYVAIVKWMKYKVIVTKTRLKKYAAVAWFMALLTSATVIIMQAFGAHHGLILVVDVILSISWVVCFCLIIYFYVKVYLKVRKQNRTQIHSVNSLVRAKLETKVAFTTFWLTLFVAISGIPAIVVYLFGRFYPIFHENSIFRWADAMLLLNSLANPLLYFYRNRRLRKAALELFSCRKPQRTQPALCNVRRSRRRRYSVASPNVEELELGQEHPRLIRAKSYGAVISSDTVRRRSHDTTQERPNSGPSKLANDNVTTQHCNRLVVTAQIENAPRKKRIHQRNTELPEDTTELKRSRHCIVGKIVRSTSLMNENSIFTLNFHKNSAEKNCSRSKSLPILSTTTNTLDNKLTVTELTNYKEPACNGFEETKL